ncbi:MAG: YkgJ family cysteine cluster protein [Promethearchaeota archaeon]
MNEFNAKFSFKCVKCARCCEAGFEISIGKKDILEWQAFNKESFLKHIYIDPKSLSSEGLGGYHIEKKNALLLLRKKYEGVSYEEYKESLKDFILNNHVFIGNSIIPLPIYTFIEELGRMPLLIPKSFDVMLEGIQQDINYLLLYERSGKCPFIKNKLCTIHAIKPKDCKIFPHDERGNIRIDNYFLKICSGIKKMR